MKNFRRAIYDSLHHWPAILLATLCSLGVATLWGANIGALLPVIEMTLKGSSTQAWLKTSVDAQHQELTKIQNLRIAKSEELSNHPVNESKAPRGADEKDKSHTASTLQFEIEQLNKQERYFQQRISWTSWTLRLAESYLPQNPFETVCLIMLILVVSTMVKHLLMLTSDLLIGRVSTEIVKSLRMRIFNRALEMDRRTYQRFGTSGILSTITHSSEALSSGLIAFFGAAVREPLRIIACLIGAFCICPRLLMLSLILAPGLIIVVAWSNRKIKAIASTILSKNGSLHEVILESLNNVFTVQAFTMEREEEVRFRDSAKSMQTAGLKMIFYTGLSRPFMELVGVGMIAITVCAGAYLLINQQTHIGFLRITHEKLEISNLLIFFGMLIGASDPLRKLSGVSNSILTGSIAANAIYSMLKSPIATIDKAELIKLPRCHNVLSLKNIHFEYTSGVPILKGIDMTIPYGRTLVILGANGSGKSTLIQLLCRFFDPDKGNIELDGIDYRDLAIKDIRRRIALVSQTTELFNRSVMENIRYGSPNATEEDVREAARLSHADTFIETQLADGYKTIVGPSGQKLSGGQRQRLALARAILRKPEILILDESTSQIDMASELQIRETLSDMKGQFTTIIITHREALCSLADETYSLESGHLSRCTTGSTHLQAA